MKRALVIDNTRDANSVGSEELRRCLREFEGFTVETRRGPEGDLPAGPAPYDRIVISGSRTSCLEEAPWIDALLEFTRQAVSQGKPLLGVCFGHQMLARALGGKTFVRRAELGEVGWTEIQRTRASRLLEGLPDRFFSFSSHYEEVSQLPAGFQTLAHSERCTIQACQFGDKPIFGIQFHPEKNLEEGEKILTEKRKMGKPKELLGLKEGKRLYDPRVAEAIFRNFMTS